MLGRSPMRGKSPKVGPKPDAINAGPKPDAGQSPKVGSKPDVGLEPDAVNAGPEPDARPKPNTVDAGPEPDVGPKPNKVNAGPEPDAGPKPNVVNAGPKPEAVPKPNVVNAGPKPEAVPKPNVVNAGPKPEAVPKPNVVNAGPKPKAGPKPNVVNACLIRKCKRCKSKGCLLVENFLQWEKKTMKEHELFRISMQECREANWPDAWGHAERRASDHVVRLSVSKKLVSVSLAWEGGSALGPQLALPWRKGEGRRWLTREGWHDSPVMWGGWPGWTASGHSTSSHGEVKTAGGLLTKVGTTRMSCGTW
ncbi:hypothetical protein CDL15_Pgr005050 [Punica granatum]|uniref:Uncharacterized protein n=1 Tax=Punica granatum TaxID=22663 RepID=A0A218W244_PUNGR|nr:hypothetical protein CDL15_Pgr005050 [Punica granatum]